MSKKNSAAVKSILGPPPGEKGGNGGSTSTSTTGNKTRTGGSNPGGASTGGAGTVTITTGEVPPHAINISNIGGKTDARNPGGMDPGDKDPDSGDEESPDTLHMVSQELLDCVHAKDAAGVASALRTAFEELDSGPPTNED